MAETSYDVFNKMSTGEPYRTYRKTHLARLRVKVLNPFDGTPYEEFLEGNPQDAACQKCYVDLWDEKELMYFKRSNSIHLESGALVEAPRPVTEVKQSFNNLSDAELKELVEGKYFGLKAAVEKMTSEEALARTLLLAEECSRPEKTLNFIRERLALLQSGELDADNSSG